AMGNCNEPVAEACLDCELPQLDRNHYFTGKLMVERDFTDEQRYYMGKLRRHNLRLHGHGVVCGLKVKRHPNPSCRNQYVIVEPGTAIDCCGREILVQREEYVDFRALIRAAWKKEHGEDSEPDKKKRVFQLCIRYRECPTEPIPALFNECGCDDTACQPNRIHESYAFDVILDPKPAHDDPAAVKLEWRSTIALAHATHAAAGEDFIFVAAQSNPDTLYAIDASNLSINTSRAFTGRTIEALALSEDGKWLFVATGGGTDPEILVLSAADINKPAANTLTIAGADAKQVKLAAAADGRLYALDIKQKQLLAWATDVTTANPPAAPKKVTVASGASALGLAPDGRYAFVAIADSAKVSAVDTATLTVAQDLSVGTGGTARPRAIAVVGVEDGDNIVALDPDNKQAYLLGWRPNGATPNDRALSLADPLGGYAFPPSAVIAGPAGNWMYVVENDAASKKNYLQPLDLHAWLLKQPMALKPAVAVGSGDAEGVLAGDARRLYVAYRGEGTDTGGVAVIDVTGGDCDGIFARSLDGCPLCDDECLVLATISDYSYDTAVDDPQIDNLKDRKLLPSTDAIVEVIKCILANCCHGGGGTGPAGPPGPPGPGVKSADAETVPAGTPAAAVFDPTTGNVHFKIPKG
ncbi:MAG TPA: hypothetical protein VNT02_13320, partial [Burkholderiales bacterium]|nr:hypothetical protein [Burkholderiales bacterium]